MTKEWGLQKGWFWHRNHRLFYNWERARRKLILKKKNPGPADQTILGHLLKPEELCSWKYLHSVCPNNEINNAEGPLTPLTGSWTDCPPVVPLLPSSLWWCHSKLREFIWFCLLVWFLHTWHQFCDSGKPWKSFLCTHGQWTGQLGCSDRHLAS